MAKPHTDSRRTLLSKFLRDYRRQSELSQTDLQQKLHCNVGYISKIETGVIATPESEFLKALAREVGRSVDELIGLSKQPEEPRENDQLLPRISVGSHAFKLVFGHSLWGAPLFHAAHEGRIPEFAVTSAAKSRPNGIDFSQPVWIEAERIVVSPGPGTSEIAALSSVDVLTLLRRGEADIGALPGNIVPEDFIRIGTIVDSAAGCTFVCRNEVFKKCQSNITPRYSQKKGKEAADSSDVMPLETATLRSIIKNEYKSGKVKIGLEENTIAHEFLRDICGRDGSQVPNLNDVKWNLRTSELATKPFTLLKRECGREHPSYELIGVLVWEPHASWMQSVELAESNQELKKVPIHFSPNELGRPHHLSYELVIRRNRIGRTNPKEKELRAAISKLLYELWDSANRLNKLRVWSADFNTIEQLSKYYRFAGPEEAIDDKTIARTLDAVGSILYSVRWDVQGLSSLF